MILEVSLEKRFPNFHYMADFAVLGERIGVFGKSGSGKSTLVQMLAGLLPPDRGTIRLDGTVLYDSEAKISLSPEQRRIGVVFQHAHLFPHLNVKRNLLYGYRRTVAAERMIDIDSLCQVLDIQHLLQRGVNTLSGGERQRVALGRALLSSPRLILLDEPLTGLDDGLKYQIIPYLQKVFAEYGIPFLFVSHSLNEMRLLAEEVLVFEKGRLAGRTTAEALARQRLGTSQVGYINLLRLHQPRKEGDLWVYQWGDTELMLTEGGTEQESLFEISSKDITLFKRHPEASSARNLFHCRVSNIFEVGNRIGVELDCGGQRLVSQVVSEAVHDLDIHTGSELYAIIKASAFRRLY